MKLLATYVPMNNHLVFVAVDISEYAKLEGGVTCLSVLL